MITRLLCSLFKSWIRCDRRTTISITLSTPNSLWVGSASSKAHICPTELKSVKCNDPRPLSLSLSSSFIGSLIPNLVWIISAVSLVLLKSEERTSNLSARLISDDKSVVKVVAAYESTLIRMPVDILTIMQNTVFSLNSGATLKFHTLHAHA